MGMFANGLFGILPLYQARRFPVEGRATGIGISYAMTSISVIAPYVIALVTPSMGLKFGMASFIAGGALIVIANQCLQHCAVDAKGDLADDHGGGNGWRERAGSDELTAGNAAH